MYIHLKMYEKTTTLKALEQYLNENYIVVRMDFQFLDASDFENAKTFVKAFCRELLRRYRKNLDSEIKEQIKSMRNSDTYVLADLFV